MLKCASSDIWDKIVYLTPLQLANIKKFSWTGSVKPSKLTKWTKATEEKKLSHQPAASSSLT